MPDDVLGRAADDLYGLPAAEFTAARNARAKAARSRGDKTLAAAIAALPRPSSAAWILNQVARRFAADVEALLELGARLREAHATLDPDRIRTLGTQRHRQIATMTGTARALAQELGQPVSDAVAREIEGTLGAAVATVEAGEAVRSGRLTKALSYAGFGEVDLTVVLAVPRRLAVVPAAPEPVPEPVPDPARERRRIQLAQQREREVLRARTAALEAERRVTELRDAQQELTEQLARAGDRVDQAEVRARQAAERLAQLEAQGPA